MLLQVRHLKSTLQKLGLKCAGCLKKQEWVDMVIREDALRRVREVGSYISTPLSPHSIPHCPLPFVRSRTGIHDNFPRLAACIFIQLNEADGEDNGEDNSESDKERAQYLTGPAAMAAQMISVGGQGAAAACTGAIGASKIRACMRKACLASLT